MQFLVKKVLRSSPLTRFARIVYGDDVCSTAPEEAVGLTAFKAHGGSEARRAAVGSAARYARESWATAAAAAVWRDGDGFTG